MRFAAMLGTGLARVIAASARMSALFPATPPTSLPKIEQPPHKLRRRWTDNAGASEAQDYLIRRGHHKRFHQIGVRQLAKAFRIEGSAPEATAKERLRHLHPRHLRNNFKPLT